MVALLALVVSALPYVHELREELEAQRPPRVVVLLVAGAVCLVWRRRRPWAVWWVTATMGLGWVVVTESLSAVYVPAVVALYTVATRVRPVRALGAAVVATVLPTLLLVAGGNFAVGGDRAGEDDLVRWMVLAVVTGIAVRNQRAVVEAARERARLAEATREEEAIRRVTEERIRIARELHDVVAHHVSVINVQAGVARQLLRVDPDAAEAALGHVRAASRTVLAEVPAMLGLLRTGEEPLETAPLPGLGDVEVLVEQASNAGLDIVWERLGTRAPLPPGTDLTAYRIVQEGLTNAARYGTGRVLLRTIFEQGGLTIELRNAYQPVTSPATSPAVERGHHGLVGMRERVRSVGGQIDIGPEGRDTWAVRSWVPLARSTGATSTVEQPALRR